MAVTSASQHALTAVVSKSMTKACDFDDPQRDLLVNEIKKRYGQSLKAILIYGSYLRGKRDTLLDFYVLVDDYPQSEGRAQRWLGRMLPPNVFQIHCGEGTGAVRAKYALMTLKQFEHAMRHDFHSYFWARFAQPCGLIFLSDSAVQSRLVAAIEHAMLRFVTKVIPLLPEQFKFLELWKVGLAMTYQCELRAEKPGKTESLVKFNSEFYEQVTTILAENNSFIGRESSGMFYFEATDKVRTKSRVEWKVRKLQGKLLSFLRILKASLTFDDALDYLLWKIERHSNIFVEPSPLQRKYPLLFAWPLLWRLYRRGAFR